MASEIGTAHLPSSHLREQPKIYIYLNPPTTDPTTDPTTLSLDSPIYPSVKLSCD